MLRGERCRRFRGQRVELSGSYVGIGSAHNRIDEVRQRYVLSVDRTVAAEGIEPGRYLLPIERFVRSISFDHLEVGCAVRPLAADGFT